MGGQYKRARAPNSTISVETSAHPFSAVVLSETMSQSRTMPDLELVTWTQPKPDPEKKKEVTVRIADEHSTAMGVLCAAEIFASFVLATCIFANDISADSTDSDAAAIASLIFFILSALVYLVFCIVTIIYCWCKRDWGKKEVAAYILMTALGGICYFVGDNLSPIFQKYADELCCSDELCTSRIKQTGVVFMTLAAAIFFLPSPYIKLDTHKDIMMLEDKDKKFFAKHFISLLKLLSAPALLQFIRFDLLFSEADNMVNMMDDTMNESLKVACPAGFILFAVFIGFFFVMTYIRFKLDIKDGDNWKIKLTSVTAVVIKTLMFAFYLLGDNMELLTPCTNNEKNVSITKFSSWVVAFFLLLIYLALQTLCNRLRNPRRGYCCFCSPGCSICTFVM